ncbi:MAG: hydroxymethylglutaryl-CoA lyase [Polaribacter sp.]|jgi:hydroxymethylglutaryl-CoA lyase
MASSSAVFKSTQQRRQFSYPIPVPNMKGSEPALEAGVSEIAMFTAASEVSTQKNINCLIEQSITRYQQVVKKAQVETIKIRGYISYVFGCPYENKVSNDIVTIIVLRLQDQGFYEISLGDTIGDGTPASALAMVETVAQKIEIEQLAAHFHDTYGQGLANIYAVLQAGIAILDSSINSLGGCPYANGASGNVSTEDLFYTLNGMHIDMDKLLIAGDYINQFLGRQSTSRVARALGNHTTYEQG